MNLKVTGRTENTQRTRDRNLVNKQLKENITVPGLPGKGPAFKSTGSKSKK